MRRGTASALYWVLVGGLVGYTCCFGIFGLPFLVLGSLLGIVGLFALASSGAWAVTVGLGGGPAFVFLMMALEDRNSPLPPCGEMEHKEGITMVAGCTPSTTEYAVLLAFFGLVTISGPLWRLLSPPHGRTS